MAQILSGAAVAQAISARTAPAASWLREQGIVPQLVIIRVGSSEDDLSYERGALKRCATVGVEVRSLVLPEAIGQDELISTIETLNADDSVHGMLLLQPLPKHIDAACVREAIDSAKDVDGITDASLSDVLTEANEGFPPCTAQACLETLDFYGIDCAGKHVVVVGRSLVIGRPVALMLISRDATVSICHSKTQDLPSFTRNADIVVAAMGRAEMLTEQYFSPGQTIIDVGINWNAEKGSLCGDVAFEKVEPLVSGITPVPGGIGTVTTAVLACHVVEAAQRRLLKA